jgi:hypothetical protein
MDDDENLENCAQIYWCPAHVEMKTVKVSTQALLSNWAKTKECPNCGYREYPPVVIPDLENLETLY